MPIDSVLATLPVTDLERSVSWYERLFGRPADSNPMPSLHEWHLTGGGGVQVTQAEDPGHGTVTLGAADLNGLIDEVRGRGVDVPAATTGTGARFAILTDPDGNTVVLATDLPADRPTAGTRPR